MLFAEHHAQIDDDPLVELERRLQLWATAPNANGEALKPDAVIVPRQTVVAAVACLHQLKQIIKAFDGATTRGSA